MDSEKLLVKLSLGKKLSENELQEVALLLEHTPIAELTKGTNLDEVYSAVHLLAKADARNFAYLLERYLDAKDPLLVALVLETLCLGWGLSASYLERVMSYALGESWDYDEDVRQTAIKIIGEYVRSQFETKKSNPAAGANWFNQSYNQAVELLFSILADSELDNHTRRSAYSALGRASGLAWEALPSEFQVLDFNQASNLEAFAELRKSMD